MDNMALVWAGLGWAGLFSVIYSPVSEKSGDLYVKGHFTGSSRNFSGYLLKS